MNEKELNKKLAKRMINPHYFKDEYFKMGFQSHFEPYLFFEF